MSPSHLKIPRTSIHHPTRSPTSHIQSHSIHHLENNSRSQGSSILAPNAARNGVSSTFPVQPIQSAPQHHMSHYICHHLSHHLPRISECAIFAPQHTRHHLKKINQHFPPQTCNPNQIRDLGDNSSISLCKGAFLESRVFQSILPTKFYC